MYLHQWISADTVPLSSQCSALFPQTATNYLRGQSDHQAEGHSSSLPALRITPEELLLVHTEQLPVCCLFCSGLGSFHRVTVVMLNIYTHSLTDHRVCSFTLTA